MSRSKKRICKFIRGTSGGRSGYFFQKELNSGKIKVIWDGYTRIENTLYFGTRKRTMYAAEIKQIQAVFEKEMS